MKVSVGSGRNRRMRADCTHRRTALNRQVVLVAGGARGIGQMAGKGSQNIIWHHGQLIDDHPAEVLVPGEEHIDVSVVQGSLPADTDVTASVQGVPSHGVGDPVLEGDAEEFVLMLPAQRFHEHAGDPPDDSAFARAWRTVAEAKQWLFCCDASRGAFV